MIACNPRVYIESGNGTVESVGALTNEGYGILIMNPLDEPVEIGIKKPLHEDFNPNDAAVTWVFKNVESLDVTIKVLLEIRGNMEAYANRKCDEDN